MSLCIKKCFPAPSEAQATKNMVFYTLDWLPTEPAGYCKRTRTQPVDTRTLDIAKQHVFPQIELNMTHDHTEANPVTLTNFSYGLETVKGWFMTFSLQNALSKKYSPVQFAYKLPCSFHPALRGS
ncbi:hypothetical protein FGO68_gene4480 [Halteria grandinella]|uniref:Uncharacterized protein n=1 Tax=Halteria grandinella TaxID=5974 RepID=A0A8J8STV1_HALGN|nr:hypothetical protein FGO68_gene4480 [Halteria grandinella]